MQIKLVVVVERNKTEAQSSSSQCSVRVLNIKETRKTRGGRISGGLITGCIFCLQVDGPITGGASKRQFTV